MPLPNLSDPRIRDELLARIERELAGRGCELYRPYAKQLEFHALGLAKRERAFLAGNQLGKTLSGANEAAIHLTGKYPPDWPGRRWDRPVVGWAAGVTAETTRDNPQRLLLGRIGSWGTGAIPRRDIIEIKRGVGVKDAVDMVLVRHTSGEPSQLLFKNYAKGREAWQGETVDFVWFDEEPDIDVYSEGVTRTNATGGITWLTVTPLQGMSEVVQQFYPEPTTIDRGLAMMTIDDAEHYSPEERERIVAAYPAHEREARAKGIPLLGSGRIFPVEESSISCAPFPVPDWWRRIAGIDFGWDHPTAGVWLAYDADADVVYVTDCYGVRQQVTAVHASAMRARGAWIPFAWPHDGYQHDKQAGKALAQAYAAEGLNMLAEHAQFEDDRGVSVEAGIAEMLNRMVSGRFKVFSHLNDWFAEFRQYHRKDGKVVKLFDDRISATRYALMMLRFAEAQAEAPIRDRYRRERSGSGSWMAG